MNDKLLSVIIPAYNEEMTIRETLKKVSEVFPYKEIIVVNDGSRDNTKNIILKIKKELEEQKSENLKEIKFVDKQKNEGKGAAIRIGLKEVSGDIVLIQDADLELNPEEYPKLLEPFYKYGADVVFGSRFRREGVMRVHRTAHFLGNKFLTWFSNFLSGLYITDMETCYKAVRSDLLKSFILKSSRFGIEPELTAKIARAVKNKRLNFYEVPVSYNPRVYAEGKKIRPKDGLYAIAAIIWFNLFD